MQHDEQLEEGQLAQAADLLDEAIARADDPSLHEDLLFSLAQVKFVGGSHREAVGLFEEVGLAYAQRYGPADDQTLLCATTAKLREATRRLLGDHAPELAEIDGFLGRLQRYQN